MKKDKVDNLLNAFCSLKAAEFSQSKPAGKEKMKITLIASSGKYILSIWEKSDDYYPVMKGGSDAVYLIRAHIGDRLIKSKKDLK